MRTPLLVGVDVHQQQNVMSFLDSQGQAPRGALSVANNRPGSEAFVEALTQVMASGGFDGIRVAAEATGWYWFHFFQLLSEHAALAAWPWSSILSTRA
jgi:hypothetical protein